MISLLFRGGLVSNILVIGIAYVSWDYVSYVLLGVFMVFVLKKVIWLIQKIHRLNQNLRLQDVDSMDGISFEHYIAQLLAERGYSNVSLTEQYDYGVDIIAEKDGVIAGCGGWSKRATLYGGDHSEDLRDPELLDPAHDPAKIRAMYTHPDFARQGVGRLVLQTCEQAAADNGFSSVELMATLSGEPLYRAAGYSPVEKVESRVGGVTVPLILMRKPL